MRKGSPKYESEYVNKVKNEISLNVDEQQDAKKHLKEYCGIDDIEPPWKDRAVCATCNQPIAWKKWLKNMFKESKLSCCEIIVAKCLKLNVDDQQDAIKILKKYCDIDDIEPPRHG